MSPKKGFRLIKNQNVKERLRALLESFPSLYLGLLRLNRIGTRWQKLIVSSSTDLVIEGYPRSANSFARTAFMRMQPNKDAISLATHTHSHAQIIQAVKLKVPTMVLLRDPLGAIRGYLTYMLEEKTLTTITPQDVKRVAERYITFYEALPPYRDGFFIARFDDVTKDYAAVSKRFVEWSKRDWRPYDPVELPQEQIFALKSHIGPNEDRERIKKEVESKVKEWLDPALLSRAQAIYEKLGKN